MTKDYKTKCKFHAIDLVMLSKLMLQYIESTESKPIHELSEVVVYRLYGSYNLYKRIKNKVLFLKAHEKVTLSFLLPEIILLKTLLQGNLSAAPGLSVIYMQLDAVVHPAIQLEIEGGVI